MQNKDIEFFLEIANSRNITKASENLFISQSVISTRLKKMEEELGYELFNRSRGGREIELTREGKAFVGIARRWHNLFEEAELIKGNSQMVLRVAIPETVYYDFLEPLIVPFLHKYPDIKASIIICDSSEVYNLMDSNLVDFGFASYESARSDIIYRHIYDQEFWVVSKKTFDTKNGKLSVSQLKLENEILLSGGNFSALAVWRDEWFDEHNSSRMEINSPHMIVNLLDEPDTWAMIPKKTATKMNERYGLKTYELIEKPESRKIYLLRHGGADITEASQIFSSEIEEFLDNK